MPKKICSLYKNSNSVGDEALLRFAVINRNGKRPSRHIDRGTHILRYSVRLEGSHLQGGVAQQRHDVHRERLVTA